MQNDSFFMTDELKYDVCVIGAGAAGIIFVLEFAKLNPEQKIILIEYGKKNDSDTNDLDNSIQINNTVNHHLPYECTNKGLGGSTASWGGRCVMYDEVDFIERPILNGGCTWDISLYDEILNYIDKTSYYFESGDACFNLIEIEKFSSKRIADNFKGGDVTDSVIERWSMPTRFREQYEDELRLIKNLTILEGFETSKILRDDQSKSVSGIVIVNRDTKVETVIKADKYVISAGTQESTRILLRNKAIFEVVPQSLGKFYQGHLSGKIATIKFWGNPRNTEFGFLKQGEVFIRRRFQFSKEYLLENNLLNTAIWLDNPLYFDPSHNSGAMSLMYLAMITPILGKKLAPPAIAYSITKGKINKIGSHFWNILKDFPKSISIPFTTFYQRYFLKRKLPGVFLYSPENNYALHFHAEQIPDKSNLMKIGDDGKTLIIDYTLLDDDIESVIKLHEKLDNTLRESNCGELIYWFPKAELKQAIRQMSKDGIHQSGTTRIAKTVEEGVVDFNLKVFGLDNLYVCSSSVFPTSGQANPTFLLGAFAIRLAKHLSNNEKD
jgi:hypothetical protein